MTFLLERNPYYNGCGRWGLCWVTMGNILLWNVAPWKVRGECVLTGLFTRGHCSDAFLYWQGWVTGQFNLKVGWKQQCPWWWVYESCLVYVHALHSCFSVMLRRGITVIEIWGSEGNYSIVAVQLLGSIQWSKWKWWRCQFQKFSQMWLQQKKLLWKFWTYLHWGVCNLTSSMLMCSVSAWCVNIEADCEWNFGAHTVALLLGFKESDMCVSAKFFFLHLFITWTNNVFFKTGNRGRGREISNLRLWKEQSAYALPTSWPGTRTFSRVDTLWTENTVLRRLKQICDISVLTFLLT